MHPTKEKFELYKEFVMKLLKNKEQLDREISPRRHELCIRASLLCSEADSLGMRLMHEMEDQTRPEVLNFMHLSMLCVGEASEALDPVKKAVVYLKDVGTLFDKKSLSYNLLEEIGDLLFSLTAANESLRLIGKKQNDTVMNKLVSFLEIWNLEFPDCKITIADAIDHNIAKLSDRYPELSYSNQLAQQRLDKQD